MLETEPVIIHISKYIEKKFKTVIFTKRRDGEWEGPHRELQSI